MKIRKKPKLNVQIKLPEVVGKGYGSFWRFKGRYRIVKGSRASKKSKTIALDTIYKMMKHPGANMLVVRKVYSTLKDSAFTELKWAIKRLKVESSWHVKESPLQMEYLPTGQKIYFRGLDDPLKVTSITVDVGNLSWMWIEEAYEVMNEADFDILDESIRGEVDDDLYKQITMSFNPWNENHWIKTRFFDADPNPDILTLTTNYKINEWLDEADLRVFENMKKNNPRRYQVAGLGNWGIVDGLVYENWKEEEFVLDDIRKQQGIKSAFGLDFGYTNDPSSLFAGLIDIDNKKLYVFDEMYEEGMSNERIAEKAITDTYYHSMFEVQRGFNVGWKIQAFDERRLQKIMQFPWSADNKTFSDNIWDNKTKLINNLHTELTQMTLRGGNPEQAIDNMSRLMKSSKSNARRVVMTESAYFYSASQEEVYKDLDIEQFQIVATLDNKTSRICRDLDLKVYDMKDYEVGVTAPPFHPYCRTVTVPYFADDFTIGSRAARGVDGRTYYVPGNMKYSEWIETQDLAA